MDTSMYLSPKVSLLPEPARQELTDFLESLLKKYQVEKPPHPYAGCMKGTVLWMSDDFNEPLELVPSNLVPDDLVQSLYSK